MKSTLDDTVTLKTAFAVAQRFLRAYWERAGRPREVGDLLSGMSLLAAGGTADPAHLHDWLRAADSVIHEGVGPIMLELKPPC